jgi:hypothetical protein
MNLRHLKEHRVLLEQAVKSKFWAIAFSIVDLLFAVYVWLWRDEPITAIILMGLGSLALSMNTLTWALKEHALITKNALEVLKQHVMEWHDIEQTTLVNLVGKVDTNINENFKLAKMHHGAVMDLHKDVRIALMALTMKSRMKKAKARRGNKRR